MRLGEIVDEVSNRRFSVVKSAATSHFNEQTVSINVFMLIINVIIPCSLPSGGKKFFSYP
jgi:hypothetical protein